MDPNATGVMIVLFDKATKANQFLVSDKKEYLARVKLGIETDTLDIDGNIIKEGSFSMPEKDKIEEVLNSFLGLSMQEVPITSAVSVNGKRLYKYQLEGKEVELPVREIEISSIELKEIYDDGFSFSAVVSSGTYIRALVRDILKKLDLIGTLSELERSAVDQIRIEDCDRLEDIIEGHYKTHDLYELLKERYEVIEDFDEKDVLNGKKMILNSDSDKVLLAKNHEVLAIYEKDNDIYRCVRGLW